MNSVMKHIYTLLILLYFPFMAFGQVAESGTRDISSRFASLYMDGVKLTDDDVRNLLVLEYGNGEAVYSDYLHNKKVFRRSFIKMGIGLSLAGSFGYLQARAFQTSDGCVSPGGFPFVLAGASIFTYGLVQCKSACKKTKKMAEDISAKSKSISISPQISPNGIGVIMNF